MSEQPHDVEPDALVEEEEVDQLVDGVTGTEVDTGVATEGAAVDEGVTVELKRELDERTLDLQRLQAEYVNYKRRVERDREAVRDTARATVLTGLLGVLDDVDRARQHGELTGGFKAVAESLERTLTGLGLESFGEPGEAFDPRIHEALMHEHSDQVDGPTAQQILQPGYRVGDRVLRPARVAVADRPPVAEPAAEPDSDPEPEPDPEPSAKPEPSPGSDATTTTDVEEPSAADLASGEH